MTDWVVAEEFSELLSEHPKIRKLWPFRRREGLGKWIALCRELHQENYDEILDLHRTLRTRIAYLVFLFSGFKGNWKTISKQRMATYGFFIFRRFWPFRPTAWLDRYRKIGGVNESAKELKTDLSHLVQANACQETLSRLNIEKPFVAIMPSSNWEGKNWPVEKFCDSLPPQLRVVVLGTQKDRPSQELVDRLLEKKISVISAIGRLTLKQAAQVLSQSAAYFGNDTGMAHLAEAVGTRAWIVYGPTSPLSGFGPWRKESEAWEADLWCRPCGKDGRFCFRLSNRYKCLKDLQPKRIEIESSI